MSENDRKRPKMTENSQKRPKTQLHPIYQFPILLLRRSRRRILQLDKLRHRVIILRFRRPTRKQGARRRNKTKRPPINKFNQKIHQQRWKTKFLLNPIRDAKYNQQKHVFSKRSMVCHRHRRDTSSRLTVLQKRHAKTTTAPVRRVQGGFARM